MAAAHGHGDRSIDVDEEMDSGGEREAPAQANGSSSSRRKKKQMYRHTPQQIQELEAMFRVCPHPDDKQRAKMSRDLGLESRQIKFWFQNRRTLMKSQHEKADNFSLRAENDRIRSENIAMKEAVRRLACRHCGLNNGSANPYFDEQRLRMDNARLKEEVDRVSNLTSKYLGRPIAHHHLPLPKPVPPFSQSQGGAAPSETLCNPRIAPSFDPSPSIPYPLRQISDSDKPMLMGMASYAMDEVILLLQLGEPLWVKSASDGAEVLELQAYQRKFPKPHQPKFSGARTEASRDSATVMMSCRMLVDAFMTPSKWMDLFPTIVSNATTVDVLASGASGSSAGSAILMYQELQILSPAVPTRELCVLRHCRRVDPSSWAIADVSVDYLLGNYVEAGTRKLPSGCLISEMANGCSKITWVEHMEIEEKNPIHVLFQHLVTSGAAFEARRWVSNLHRTAERNAFSISAGIADDLGGVIPTPEAKQSMMKLAQRMVKSFCATFSGSIANKWTMMSRPSNDAYQVYFHKTDASRLAGGEIVSAATSVWLPLHAERLFSFLKDEQNRNLWEVSKEELKFQRVAHFINGSNSGNSISIVNRLKSSSSLLILQESCTDASGSLLVYSPIGLSSLDMVRRGEDTSSVQLIVSGFTIVPDDGFAGAGPLTGSSSPAGGLSGSLLTVGFQTVTNKTEGGEIGRESVSSINAWIGHTIEKIKAALFYH